MSRYTTKLQNIMEANIRLEKRLLTEQQSTNPTYELETYKAKRFVRRDMMKPETSSDGKNYELEITKATPNYVIAKIKCTDCDISKGEGMYDETPLNGANGYELTIQKINGKDALSGNLRMGDFMDLEKINY